MMECFRDLVDTTQSKRRFLTKLDAPAVKQDTQRYSPQDAGKSCQDGSVHGSDNGMSHEGTAPNAPQVGGEGSEEQERGEVHTNTEGQANCESTQEGTVHQAKVTCCFKPVFASKMFMERNCDRVQVEELMSMAADCPASYEEMERLLARHHGDLNNAANELLDHGALQGRVAQQRSHEGKKSTSSGSSPATGKRRRKDKGALSSSHSPGQKSLLSCWNVPRLQGTSQDESRRNESAQKQDQREHPLEQNALGAKQVSQGEKGSERMPSEEKHWCNKQALPYVDLPMEEFDPADESKLWQRGEEAPYAHLALTYEEAVGTTKRLRLADIFSNCFRAFLALGTREEIVNAVYLTLGRVADDHEGGELTVGGKSIFPR